jgi:hypothetical protein
MRPYKLRAASPLREFRFVNLPGRPSGTSPQEMLNPIQRAYNRGWAQLLEHRALMSNPIVELDANSGLESKDFVNRPGAVIPVHKRPGVEAFRYVVPPQISGDVWRIQQQLSDVLDHLGNIPGAQGSAPTLDASGELVKELRYNSDRFVGPTSKRMVLELARMIEDWVAILPVMWTTEKVLAYAGADSVVRTLTVLPEMFDGGKVHVLGDIESMLPEGRGERQQRVEKLYAMGAFGQPGAPERDQDVPRAVTLPAPVAHDAAGWRRSRHRRAVLGHDAARRSCKCAPALEWYDVGVHLDVFEEYMKSPEYLRQPPPIRGSSKCAGRCWSSLARCSNSNRRLKRRGLRRCTERCKARWRRRRLPPALNSRTTAGPLRRLVVPLPSLSNGNHDCNPREHPGDAGCCRAVHDACSAGDRDADNAERSNDDANGR